MCEATTTRRKLHALLDLAGQLNKVRPRQGIAGRRRSIVAIPAIRNATLFLGVIGPIRAHDEFVEIVEFIEFFWGYWPRSSTR